MRPRTLAVVLATWAVVSQTASRAQEPSPVSTVEPPRANGPATPWSPRLLNWAEDLLITYGFFV